MLYANVLKLYHKLCHGNLPAYVTNLFTCVVPGSTHDYDFRPSCILKMPTAHTCVAERCIRFIFPKIINDTDLSVTEEVYTHSFQWFTNSVKVTKINSYATRCLIANCYICRHSWCTNNCLCSELMQFLVSIYVSKAMSRNVASLYFWDCMLHAVYGIFKAYLRTLDIEPEYIGGKEIWT